MCQSSHVSLPSGAGKSEKKRFHALKKRRGGRGASGEAELDARAVGG